MLEPVTEGRLRLDAGTWGTMGVGLGYAIAAATATDRLVVAVEGDSAFGFSGMECETIARCDWTLDRQHKRSLRRSRICEMQPSWHDVW